MIKILREDVGALSRRLRKQLGDDRAQQRQRRVSGAALEAAPTPDVLDCHCIGYPVGWNHEGTAVSFEVQSMAEVGGAVLKTRAPSVDTAKRRIAWLYAERLMRGGVEAELARRVARRSTFHVQMLDRRPEGAQ